MKETNMEHFRGEIETACHGIKLKNGEIYMCHGAAECQDCEPVLTQREKHFVEFAQEGWLARDEHGGIYYYFDKPTKEWMAWEVDSCVMLSLDKYGDNLFPFITWEDEEPWSVEELRKLKVQE